MVGASDIAALVKQAVDIVDVVGQAIPLRRNGSRHIGLCPFHQEKTPSFQVDAESQFFHCFGCGAGGDVLTFVMKHQNLSFAEAVSYLADKYHVNLPQTDYAAHGSAAETAVKEREKLYQVLQTASDFFYAQLQRSEAGTVARSYLSKRGLPPDIVEAERIGYAPSLWDGLLRHLEERNIDADLGVKAGLLSVGSKNRIFDRFRNRLIFPIRDDRDRIVAFGGRSLSGEMPDAAGSGKQQDEPKYLNSPETLLYHKGRMLYQLSKARRACRQIRQAVLVEGYMDLLAFHARGFYRVVATLGTALTAQQVRLLSHMADEVVLAYDADEAGEKAMLRALPLFLQEELSVTCIRFPEGMDPDDFLKARGEDGLRSLLQERRELGSYALEKALRTWDGSVSGKSKVLTQLQPVLEGARQPVLRSEYVRILSEGLSLPESVVESQIEHGKRRAQNAPRPYRQVVQKEESKHFSLEENVLRLLSKLPGLIEEMTTSLDTLECFETPQLRAIAQALVEAWSSSRDGFNASMAYNLLQDDDQKELFTGLLLEPTDFSEPLVQLRDWLEALRGRKARQRRAESFEALRQAQLEKDSPESRNSLSPESKDILAQLKDFYSVKKRAKDSPENVEGERHR